MFAVFAGFGLLFIGLALTGNSDTAPVFQAAMGRWMRALSDYLDEAPNVVSLPVLALLLAKRLRPPAGRLALPYLR